MSIPNLEGEHTPLYPRTKKAVIDLYERINRDKLTPWTLLLTGKPVKLTDHYGGEISIRGVKFEGSARLVFWGGLIEPFIEDGIIKILDSTVELCREANLNPEPYIDEAVGLLSLFIKETYSRMADIDEGLRGRGYGVRREVVEEKIELMQGRLEEHKNAAKLLSSASHTKEDIIIAKPSIYGMGLNLNELWRRVIKSHICQRLLSWFNRIL